MLVVVVMVMVVSVLLLLLAGIENCDFRLCFGVLVVLRRRDHCVAAVEEVPERQQLAQELGGKESRKEREKYLCRKWTNDEKWRNLMGSRHKGMLLGRLAVTQVNLQLQKRGGRVCMT